MTFYNFHSEAPKYSYSLLNEQEKEKEKEKEEKEDSPSPTTTVTIKTIAATETTTTNREVSFNFSESFFQIPASLEESPSGSPPEAEASVFCVPETQYTPKEETELVANMTIDQSVLLPSLSMILEESLRTVEGQRQRSSSSLVSSTSSKLILLQKTQPHLNLNESSATTAGNPNLNPNINVMPQQHRIMDKLDMPSQQLHSPLLVGNRGGGAMELIEEDSLLLQLNSSVLYENENMNMNIMASSLELKEESELESKSLLFNNNCNNNNNFNNHENDLKFSLDFLNTPPPPAHNQNQNHNQSNNNYEDNERVSTQILLQNMMELSSNLNAEISLLSINEDDDSPSNNNNNNNNNNNSSKKEPFNPLNIIPNSPTERDDGHDAILFPASFDESNNPFSYNYREDQQLENNNLYLYNNDTTVLTTQMVNNINAQALAPTQIPMIDLNSILLLSTRKQQRQNSTTTLEGEEEGSSPSSPATKLNPLIIKSSSSSSLTLSKSKSLSLSNESVSSTSTNSTSTTTSAPAPIVIPSSVKKTLGIARLNAAAAASSARKSLSNSLAKQVISSSAAASVLSSQMSTPIKSKDNNELKYLEHMLKTEKKKISVIQAEPRKTPIAGISTSTVNSSSKININSSTPHRMKVSRSSIKLLDVEKENSDREVLKERRNSGSRGACAGVEAADSKSLKYPHPLSTSTVLTTSSPCKSDTSSSNYSSNFDCVNNLSFRENQWVFFKDDTTLSLYSTGSVLGKTSKTRDLWRVKQSNGSESTVSSVEMCPVAFLRPFDEFFLKTSHEKYKFKRFNSQNANMLECELFSFSSSSVSGSDKDEMVKMTRISIERETFTRIRNRFERGCLEDSQIRDQIMNLSLIEEASLASLASASAAAVTVSKKGKRTSSSVSSLTQPTTQKMSTAVAVSPQSCNYKKVKLTQIFADMKFLITVGDNQEDTALKLKYTKLIESHGGELMLNLPTDPETQISKIYLLSNGFRRTAKFMTAIIRGIPRVNFSWIEECCARESFIDPNCSSFLIEPPTGSKPIGILFKGKKFYLDGTAKFKNSWVPVLRMLGGTVTNFPAASGAAAPAIITLSESLKNMKAGGSSGGVGIVNIDWLIRCIVEKSVTFL